MNFGIVSLAETAEWSLSPSIGVKGVYDSNLLLTSLPHADTYGYWITPATELTGKTERLDVSSRIAANFVEYFGGEDRQFTNVFAPLAVRYRTEKDILGFNGGFTRDNTLLGELQETGVVLQFTQRNQWTFNPSWTRNLTETLSWRTDVQFSDTSYGGGQSRLFDYQLVGGSGGFSYQVTERDQVQLIGSYTEFRITNSPFPVRASFPGVNLSMTHAFNESLTGTVYGGPRLLSSSTEVGNVGVIHAQDTVWVAGASLSKNFERAMIQASIAHDLAPSGFGLLITTDRAELSSSYRISETIACSLNVVGILSSGKTSVASGASFPDSRYVSVVPKLSWKVSEWWETEISYMYRWRDIDSNPEAAHSHVTTFMLTYSPPKLSLSR